MTISKEAGSIIRLSLYVLLAIVYLIFVAYISSALSINPNSINVNKTQGSVQTINFNIVNNDNFTFYNISFPDANILSMPKIAQLNPGQQFGATASVITNNPGVYNLNLQGFYIANIGASNKQYQINVSNSEVQGCSMTAIQGDTISWRNNVAESIVLFDADSGNTLSGSINSNDQFSLSPSAGKLNYYFKKNDIPFSSPLCTLTTLSTSGLVQNPDYDGHLQTILAINFPPTTINPQLLTNNYIMNFTDITDGVFSITNTGSQTAQHVILEGTWLSFSQNDFSISPGQTKGITYSINPIIISTEQTNKTYLLNLSISGNFVSQSLPISVFINPYNFNAFNSSGNQTQDLLNFCAQFPDPKPIFCPQSQQQTIIIRNNSGGSVNVSVVTAQVQDALSRSANTDNMLLTIDNRQKQDAYDIKNNISITADAVSGIEKKLDKKDADDEQKSQTFWNIIITLGSISAISACTWIYHIKKGDKKENEQESYYSGDYNT